MTQKHDGEGPDVPWTADKTAPVAILDGREVDLSYQRSKSANNDASWKTTETTRHLVKAPAGIITSPRWRLFSVGPRKRRDMGKQLHATSWHGKHFQNVGTGENMLERNKIQHPFLV